MTTGPDRVVECPSCKALVRHFTLMSGNTFGARIWSDGRQDAPMLPSPPEVVRCHACRRFYWLREARVVGSVDRFGDRDSAAHPDWILAPEATELSADEYYEAIRTGLAANAEQERNLRVLAWWRRNDVFRDGKGMRGNREAEAGSTEAVSNMEALASLLDEREPNDRLMKAEVLRELGQFETASALLDHPLPPAYEEAVDQLRSLCRKRVADVRELDL